MNVVAPEDWIGAEEWKNYTMLGDVDKSGKVTGTDVFQLKQHIVEIKKLENNITIRADINGDGKITSTDLLMQKRLSVGLNPDGTNPEETTTA